MDKEQNNPQIVVLILENDEEWQDIFFDIINNAGHKAIVVDNLSSARKTLQTEAIDMVVVDLWYH